MEISKEEFNKLCTLSRLEFTQSEKEELCARLKILTDMTYELDIATIANCDRAESVLSLVNALRLDEVKPSMDRAELLKNAPKTDGTYFIVPKVME